MKEPTTIALLVLLAAAAVPASQVTRPPAEV